MITVFDMATYRMSRLCYDCHRLQENARVYDCPQKLRTQGIDSCPARLCLDCARKRGWT